MKKYRWRSWSRRVTGATDAGAVSFWGAAAAEASALVRIQVHPFHLGPVQGTAHHQPDTVDCGQSLYGTSGAVETLGYHGFIHEQMAPLWFIHPTKWKIRANWDLHWGQMLISTWTMVRSCGVNQQNCWKESLTRNLLASFFPSERRSVKPPPESENMGLFHACLAFMWWNNWERDDIWYMFIFQVDNEPKTPENVMTYDEHWWTIRFCSRNWSTQDRKQTCSS